MSLNDMKLAADGVVFVCDCHSDFTDDRKWSASTISVYVCIVRAQTWLMRECAECCLAHYVDRCTGVNEGRYLFTIHDDVDSRLLLVFAIDDEGIFIIR